MTSDPAKEVWEMLEASRLDGERLESLVAEKARKYEGKTLEQIQALLDEAMSGAFASVDDFKTEYMAARRAMRVKAEARVEALRAGGFDIDEPMQ